jgi:hypothetical protein
LHLRRRDQSRGARVWRGGKPPPGATLAGALKIFVAGEFVGGCTDLFDQCKSGGLMARLQAQRIAFNPTVTADPYGFLPGWLHSR